MKAVNSPWGLVLSGGQSSRMGQDKSRLEWNGVPLYEHMRALLNRVGISHVMISNNRLQGQDVITDIIPGCGPLSGIHAALTHLSDGDYLLVLPVDMPLLPMEALQRLTQEKVTSSYEDFTLPLWLLITPAVRQWIDTSIRSNNPQDYALWRLHQAVQGKTIALPESMKEAFSNANTPEDWQRCQKLGATLSRNDAV